MIRTALITGFLGSGKTTLLGQLARRYAGRRVAMVVNEFSAVDVDAARLTDQSETPVMSIAGGSIFCRCKVTDFIDTLETIAQQHPSLEGIIIEASGIADPRVMARMLEETGLDRTFRLSRIVCVVDAGQLPKLLRTLPNITYQIAASDVVLLNKADLYPTPMLDAAERQVRAILPAAAIHRTVRCDMPLNLFDHSSNPPATGDYAPCADPAFGRFVLKLTRPCQPEQIQQAFQPLRDDLYRLKGQVRNGDALQAFDLTPSGAAWGSTSHPASDAVLVGIVRGTRLDEAMTIAARFGDVTSDHASASASTLTPLQVQPAGDRR